MRESGRRRQKTTNDDDPTFRYMIFNLPQRVGMQRVDGAWLNCAHMIIFRIIFSFVSHNQLGIFSE